MPERLPPLLMRAMQRITEEIASLAEHKAGEWKNVPGDVALRQFADAIRETNRVQFTDT